MSKKTSKENREKLVNLMMSVYGASSEDELSKKLILKYRCFNQPEERVVNNG